MLAPCFKTSDELGLTPSQHAALIKVLGMLERGELWEIQPKNESNVINAVGDPRAFSMRGWSTCICGHAKRLGGEWDNAAASQGGPTGSLFYRTSLTMAEATTALRDFLTMGL